MLSVFVWQPLVVYAYLCLPRVALVLLVPSSELQLNRGFFDQTLAYVGVLLGLYHLFRLIAHSSDERGIVYADCDPGAIIAARRVFDTGGHYRRPDVVPT